MITKEKLEEKLSNGEVCGNCHACNYCGEIGQDCYALRLLQEITGYPSFDHSQINCVVNIKGEKL